MSNLREDYGLRSVEPVSVSGLGNYGKGIVVTSNELIGIEVEVENFTVATQSSINRAWQTTTDGSLRNNGAEVVSRPVMASMAPAMLDYLFNQYLNAKDCCFGPRTSIHIHINVQDLTRTQAVDMILMYAIYEKLFYKFAGRGRQKNVYCVPLSDCDLLVNLVEYGETRGDNWSKYTGFNTLPIRTYGTIEFRHMHGTTDVKKLATWINLICKLKEYVKRTPTKTIRSTIAEMNDNFDFGALMHEVFGEYAEAFLYEGPQELNYLQAKQALATQSNLRSVVTNVRNDSSFFSFKG